MAPNALVSFLTVFIFSVVWYWNETYMMGLLLLTGTPTIALSIERLWEIMAIYLYGRPEGRGPDSFIVWVQAGCLMAISPLLVMYIFLQKHFVEGVERSGITG
jgi:multiple sugar transport system permease protein